MAGLQPRYQSAVARKDARRQIRNTLGTSSDDAPTVLQAITAAQHLDTLMQDASDGVFRVQIVRLDRSDQTGNVVSTRPLTWAEARRIAKGEQQ